jgi:hypothetical protein
MPDGWIPGPTNDTNLNEGIRNDFPSVLARQGAAAWFANTAFGYGDDEAITDSELLMLYFSEELGNGAEMPIGQAMVNAKNRYLNGFAAGSLGIYEAKSMMAATLYGLPMHTVTVPTPQPIASLFPAVGPFEEVTRLASPIVDGVLVSSQEEPRILTADLSAQTINLAIPAVPALTENVTQRGRFFSAGGKDAVQVYPGRPLEPRLVISTGVPANTRGAVLMSATFTDIANFDPVVTNPATDTTRLEATLSENGWFPPTDGVWVVNR